MTRPLTFARGGISIPTRSQESRTAPVSNAPVPSVAVVSMGRRQGPPAECLVAPGDHVAEGQVIGRPGGGYSVPVHAPIPGTVAEVRDTLLPDGTAGAAAVIELGGAFTQSGRPRPARAWAHLGPAEIVAAIGEAGVDLDGYPQPLAVRLRSASSRPRQVLIVNTVESDPWLAAESRLIADRPAEVAEGVRIVQAALACPRAVLAVTGDSAPAAERTVAACRAAGGSLETAVFDARFPQEEESRLACALLGREPPRGGTALDIGAVVVSASSLVAVRDAVVLGKPCFERVVTVAGPALRTPRNLKVRIGTRAGELVEEAGGLARAPAAVVFGSAMQGHAFAAEADWRDIPVTRETSAVLLLTRRVLARGRERPCLRCGRCADVCPWGLVPVRLYELAGSGSLAQASAEGLGACRGCGCCSYACPSHLPLSAGLREAQARSTGGAA
jgi:electron transport complex protein RnfC